MKTRTTVHWTLTAAIVATLSLTAFAQNRDRPEREPAVGKFALDVSGVLAMPTADDGEGIRVGLEGNGRAVASRRGVALKFSELSDANGRVAVDIRFDNPLEARSVNPRHFAGHGVARISVGDRVTVVRVAVHGTIHRTSADGAAMRGHWRAVESRDRIDLSGSFRGRLVDDADEPADDS